MDIYIVLKPETIGGAEKRFIGLWQHLVSTTSENNYFLVLSKKLYDLFLEMDDFVELLLQYKKNIIFYNINGSYWKCSLKAYQFIKQYNSKNCAFHFIEFFPLFFPFGTKMLFTITASNLYIYNLKGRIPQYLGALLAAKTDILDPTIHRLLSKKFSFKKRNFTITPCTFCNYDLYKIEEKQNWIVFLGVFSPVKQPLKYLKSIPAIYEKLKPLNLAGLKFYILGNDGMEAEMYEEFKSDKYKDLPIEMRFELNPERILNKSKVFISVQKFNNYPSKSLLEAIAAGNLPVVTDNGQTRLIAKDFFSYYVKEDFENNEIAEKVFDIFTLNNKDFTEKSNLARQFAMENHNIKRMADYFNNQFYK